ncbi:MAG TPA: glutamate--tRNA ligase, partial [Ferruginibacter sp.]|nr:glutamate--tRNA ligase [Ferruginibacter sp.]
FDTPEEIEAMRERLKTAGSHSLQYDHHIRQNMKNSLNLLPEETQKLLDAGTPYVIRIKVEPDEHIHLTDMIRGEISFDTNTVDDKVLLKADGMPTYHLAVVVDDHLMKITHAFRGEEWLPSAPIHVLLWKYLFGLDKMPQWAHLPLILKPDGNGKLSKRDGDRLGFPVYAMDWKDPITRDITKGFKELGFLPEAFNNLLAVLGWNDGTEQEVFSMEELIDKFSMERVHKGGAKFDFEKAKWFNHEWIKRLPADNYAARVADIFEAKGVEMDGLYLLKVIEMIKDRCTLLSDFFEQGIFFFKAPSTFDEATVKPKWDEKKQLFFAELIKALELNTSWQHDDLENGFKELAAANQLKTGELMLPFRIMLVGGKFGPSVFNIATLIGKKETISRIKKGLSVFNS